ncbi:MAG: hypothetical protein H0X03_09370 [Nitrosopumilus sp.]|nr:hypothetical protein [Nitrosopumilus sp.]
MLQSTECERYTVNGIQACFNEVTFKLEGENQRTVLTVTAIDQNGIQYDITFVASNDIYDRFLPVGDYMINSLKVDTTKLLETLNMRSINDASQQNDIPPIVPDSELPDIPTNMTTNNFNNTFNGNSNNKLS